MSNVIQTNDGRYYQKPGFGATAAGIMAGSVASGAVTMLQQPFAEKCMSKMGKIAQSSDVVEIRKGLGEALKLGGVSGQVTIKDFANEPYKKPLFSLFDDLMDKDAKNGSFFSRLKSKLLKKAKEQADVVGAIRKGKNAGFNPLTNEVLINTEKLGVSGFHEIGHSINFNKSKFWKVMQKLRMPSMAIAGLLATVALFKRKKADGEEPKGFFDKTTTFIKENVGKLTTLSMLPVVAEELMATKRGNALAKKVLSPENYSKVVKANKYGAATYIAAALALGVGAYVANKVKDAIAKPKEIKVAE